MRNILFLWIIIRSRSILLAIHPIKLLSAFPLQSLLHWCKSCFSKHVETISHAQRFISRAHSWWHALSLMVKVTFEKRKMGKRQSNKRENENSWQQPARPGQEQQQGQQAAPVALVKGHRAATEGQAVGMQRQALGIAQVKAPQALPSYSRKHLKSS